MTKLNKRTRDLIRNDRVKQGVRDVLQRPGQPQPERQTTITIQQGTQDTRTVTIRRVEST